MSEYDPSPVKSTLVNFRLTPSQSRMMRCFEDLGKLVPVLDNVELSRVAQRFLLQRDMVRQNAEFTY